MTESLNKIRVVNVKFKKVSEDVTVETWGSQA